MSTAKKRESVVRLSESSQVAYHLLSRLSEVEKDASLETFDKYGKFISVLATAIDDPNDAVAIAMDDQFETINAMVSDIDSSILQANEEIDRVKMERLDAGHTNSEKLLERASRLAVFKNQIFDIQNTLAEVKKIVREQEADPKAFSASRPTVLNYDANLVNPGRISAGSLPVESIGARRSSWRGAQ